MDGKDCFDVCIEAKDFVGCLINCLLGENYFDWENEIISDDASVL